MSATFSVIADPGQHIDAGELIQVLVDMAAARGQVWRFVDGGTQEEWQP